MLNMAPRMGEFTMYGFIFLFTLFELVLEAKMSAHANSHDFIPAESEARYIVDGMPVNVHQELNSGSSSRIPNIEDNVVFNSNTHLKFEPPLLDFKKRHLGMPHHEKVTLFNINKNQTIHMSSISGNTVHFHSSFFEDKIIPPLGNTTFSVVFLGREEGEIESNLFIHTSEGSFKYSVKGSSVGSPYRLRPLVGAKVPLNSSYSPLIYMYNPHSSPMQIVEIYSSGGEFHLELPSGELEGPKHLWEIPPYHTKPVIRVRFFANTEKNHTAYIRIKVNNSEEVLVVPLEVEVAPHLGLFYPDNVVDFGRGGSLEKPKQIKLLLYNSWKKTIRIQNIVATPASKAVHVEFQPVKVPPDSQSPVEVAVLTFDWKTAFDTNHFNGRLIIKTNHSAQKLVIPYTAVVLDGGLYFNASVTQYCSDLEPNLDIRNLTITNNFRVPVAITETSLPHLAESHFLIQNFTSCILKPRESITLFRLAFNRESASSDLKLDSYITLHTNVSKIYVPLFYYSGRLLKEIPSRYNETYLNFGLVGAGKTKSLRFALFNNNPVPIALKDWGTNLTGGTVELLGFKKGNISTIFVGDNFDAVNTHPITILLPGQYAVYQVHVTAPNIEGMILAEVFIKTQFEHIAIVVKINVSLGDLEVPAESAMMEDCFPGKLCVLSLSVRSLFERPMEVRDIGPSPASSMPVGFSLKGGSIEPTIISPLTTSHIGEIRYDPGISCNDDCYLGSPSQTVAASKWIHSLSLPSNTYKADVSLFNSLYDKYVSLTSKSQWQNISVNLDTTEVRDFKFQIGVKLTWPELMPDLLNSSTILFPLAQVGNKTFQELRLTNPSSHPLSLQLVMEWVYLKDGKKMIGAPGRFENLFRDFYNVTPHDFIMESMAEQSSQQFRVPAHHESLTFLLDPGKTVTAKIGFTPRKAGLSSALLFVRNNLTVLDIVRLTGKAVEAHFKFGNRKPGSGTPLLFELAEKHLKDCEREKSRKFPVPNLTVKRSFTARNTGELPIHIIGFSINNLPCEGYGFRVLNCNSFHLPPNGTRKIDIAFTPDFTLARIQRTLSIETSLGVPVNYTLITTLPPFFLASCSSVLGRPSWEPLLYYSAVSFMIFLLFCVLAGAFLESDRILKCALVAMAKDRVSRSTTEFKPIFADVHKTIEKMKQPSSQPILEANDWGVRPEKPNESPPVISKASSWVQPETRRFSLEAEIKEQAVITQKFDEVDASVGYSNTTPLPHIKSKKKLGKRNSNNSDASETLPDPPSIKKSWGSVFARSNNHNSLGSKLKVPATVPEPESKQTTNHVKENGTGGKKHQESRKEAKRAERLNKSLNNKKAKLAPEPVVCSEEESSSTTTDSSNNEELEKERESSGTSLSERAHKSTPKKAKGKSVDYRDNYEGDCDDDDYDRDAHKKRWKLTNHKPLPMPEIPVKIETPSPKPIGLQLPYKLKVTNTNRDRKDKNALKRITTEKPLPTKLATIPDVIPPPVVRASPPPRPSNVWTENRASFSDVVARNDSPSYSTVVAPRKQAVQSLTSQPVYETSVRKPQTAVTTGLGPIGSKKPHTNVWTNFVDPHQLSSQFMQQDSNSLFTSTFHENQQHLATVQENVKMQYNSEIWQQQNAMSMLQEEQMKREAEEYRQLNLYKNQESWPASLWDPMYTPAVSATPLYAAQERENVQQGGGALWWSSVVDSTWSTPWFETTPPASANQNNGLAQPDDVDQVQAYDPFRSLNNIWTPQSPDPWNKPRND